MACGGFTPIVSDLPEGRGEPFSARGRVVKEGNIYRYYGIARIDGKRRKCTFEGTATEESSDHRRSRTQRTAIVFEESKSAKEGSFQSYMEENVSDSPLHTSTPVRNETPVQRKSVRGLDTEKEQELEADEAPFIPLPKAEDLKWLSSISEESADTDDSVFTKASCPEDYNVFSIPSLPSTGQESTYSTAEKSLDAQAAAHTIDEASPYKTAESELLEKAVPEEHHIFKTGEKEQISVGHQDADFQDVSGDSEFGPVSEAVSQGRETDRRNSPTVSQLSHHPSSTVPPFIVESEVETDAGQPAAAESATSGMKETASASRPRFQKAGPAPKKSERARYLFFPLAKLKRNLKKFSFNSRCRNTACIFVGGVLEHLCAEMLDVSHQSASRSGRTRIKPFDIQKAVEDDDEFHQLLSHVIIPSHLSDVIVPKYKSVN